MNHARAAEAMRDWLLPAAEFAPAELESRFDCEQLRTRYNDHYAADLLRRIDRDSLAEMIQRLVSLVREKLQELFNQQGREAMREELVSV